VKQIISIILIITGCFVQTVDAQICINPQNNVGISNDNPINGKLDVLNNTSSNNRISINNQNNYSGNSTSDKVGILNTVSQHGSSRKVGLSNIVTQNSNNAASGIYNSLTSNNGNGQLIGTSNYVTNAAGAKSYCYGSSTNLVLEALVTYAHGQSVSVDIKNNTGTAYSTRNSIKVNGPYSVDANGTYNQMIDNDAGATGYRRGIFNQIRTQGGNGEVEGIHNVIETNGTSNNRDVFGLYNDLECETTGTKIGINNKIENKWSGGTLKGIQNHVTSRSNAENVSGIESTVDKNHDGQVHGFLSRLTLPHQYGNAGTNYGIYSAVYKNGSYNVHNESIYGIYSVVNENFIGDDDTEELLFRDMSQGTYKKLILRDNVIVGAVLYGDTIDGSWYFQLMKDGTNISDFRDSILFGQAHLGDAGHGDETRVAAMADNAEICGCNGVCKSDIVNSITENKLFTLDEVRAHTKASASCGSCTGLVESLLAHTLGGDYSQAPSKKALCGCTDLSHEEVREGIRKLKLKDHDDVRKSLNWKTEDGCATCRPAVNYYLLCENPDYNDPESRFINERAHGNIQKDGTYSVVPRMFGGMCTPEDLHAIADVAQKFKVPEMKVTGGQRIDMFGIKKEDLPAVWKDLGDAGFVSGHAYGKAMRTCKTCVGDSWCRMGTQDSTTLGVKLEELTWGSWMPHKYKLAVSGCPRNCAEATIKDFGVVCVDSGYEIHVGGNGGIKVRVTDFLVKLDTQEEVLEYCAAFSQFYREDAHYLERTAPWIERVGLDKIKAAVIDDENNRKALYERFIISQKPAQIDPWKEHAKGVDENQFKSIKITAA